MKLKNKVLVAFLTGILACTAVGCGSSSAPAKTTSGSTKAESDVKADSAKAESDVKADSVQAGSAKASSVQTADANTYVNTACGIKIALPEGYAIQSKNETSPMEFIAVKATTGSTYMIMHTELPKTGAVPNEDQILEVAKTYLSGSLGSKDVKASVGTMNFAGEEAKVLYATMTSQGKEIHVIDTVKVANNTLYQFMAVSAEGKEAAEQMVKAYQKA